MAYTVSRLISDEALNKVIQIESAGNPDAKAPTSSAAGLGQFINSTWLGVVRKHKPALLRGKNDADVCALRRGRATASLQVELLARFTEDNARGIGRGWTEGDLYLAHFLGLGAAKKFYNADSNASAEALAGAAAVAANRSILAGKTVGEVRAWAQHAMDQRWAKAGKPDWVAKWYTGGGIEPPDVPPIPAPIPPPPIPKPRPYVRQGFAAALLVAMAALGGWLADHWAPIVMILVTGIAGGFIFKHIKRKRDNEDRVIPSDDSDHPGGGVRGVVAPNDAQDSMGRSTPG